MIEYSPKTGAFSAAGLARRSGSPAVNVTRPQNKTMGRVVSEYQSAYTEPFVIRAGEKLTAGDRVSEWAGWVWCTNQMGKSRWVPEKYLARKGNVCTALCDYEATELAVRVGEILELGQEESDWVWCANQSGQSGWVPLDRIQRISSPSSTTL